MAEATKGSGQCMGLVDTASRTFMFNPLPVDRF